MQGRLAEGEIADEGEKKEEEEKEEISEQKLGIVISY